MLRIGIVAGEASGDYLGANLLKALRKTVPELEVEGIGGPKMEQQGLQSRVPIEKLSVMGLIEVLGRYTELVRIRNNLYKYFVQNPPDIFIGIDAPDFNLTLEKRLHKQGIKTVHYVSPQVWAWREYRLKNISKAVDMMLTLFPFEEDYYESHKIPVTYVGHPLATEIGFQTDKITACDRLELPIDKKIIALMPGSRHSEIDRMLEPFLLAADWCLKQRQDLHFVSSLLSSDLIQQFNETRDRLALGHLPVSVFMDRSRDVLEATDVALLASGTITLEAMLFKKPMVVGYRLNWFTYHMVMALIKVKYAALPNLLAGSEVVPECIQADCTPNKLGTELLQWLSDNDKVAALTETFTKIHKSLRLDSADRAARAILNLI